MKKNICSYCIYDSDVPNIQFDEKNKCNYCYQIEDMKKLFLTGEEDGLNKINEIVEEIKFSGKQKKYDCVIGVSGGTDSSFILHWAVKKGLRPLAVHYDNTWNTAIATQNIALITDSLNIDLYTHVVDNKEIDDLYRSFIFALVPAIDIVTDIALTQVMYSAANKFNIKYVIEGHSFITEGISPAGYSYFDGKYIESIHEKFGTKNLKTFPNMGFYTFLYWVLYKRIKKIRPLWYLNYTKSNARELLEKKYGWKYYGGHHLENKITAFSHSYHNPIKFNIDQRNNSIAASVRNGEIKREEGIKQYLIPPKVDNDLINYTLNRLGFTKKEFKKIINMENKNWFNYPTYKKRFEKLQPLFYLLAKAQLVPMSFYLKYCFPIHKK